jgi:hypothetical protein
VSGSNEGGASSEASLSPQDIEDLKAAFDFLYCGLREAKRRFETGDDSGRDGAIHAVETVVKFLSGFEPVVAEALHTPLARLFTDLMALNDGTRSAILAPSPTSGRTRANAGYDALKGIAVFTVRRLEATGMRPTEARKIVAETLNKLNIRPARKGSSGGSGRITERSLRAWREAIAADVGCNFTPAQTLRDAEKTHSNLVLTAMGLSCVPEGSTPDSLLLSRSSIPEVRRSFLDRLSSFAVATRAAETT